MSVVTWWLTERDNQGLGKCRRAVTWNNEFINPPQRGKS
jgi:hypothetical protein